MCMCVSVCVCTGVSGFYALFGLLLVRDELSFCVGNPATGGLNY